MKNAALFMLILFASVSLSFAQLAGDVSVTQADAVFPGENAGDLAGHHVSIIGDIDDDGYDDFVITAPNRDENESMQDNGAAYLFYGSASGWSAQIDLATADAMFTGAVQGNEASHDVFGLGDIDHDGYPDFGIGIKKYNGIVDDTMRTKLGKVYIFFGSSQRYSGELSLETAAASLLGTNENAEAAHVMGVGDVDGDSYDDFIVGAGFHSQIGPEAGKVYLFFGKPQNEWTTDAAMEDVAGASFLAEAAGDWAGHRVAGIGDVNDDGKADFLVGANNVDSGELIKNGKVYLILGKARAAWQTNVSLSQADASWIGPNKQGLGWNVASPGDVDGDSIPDMLFGQKKNDYFLLLSKNLVLAQNQPIETTADVVFSHSSTVWDDIGHDNSTLGDVNADGIDDFIIGGSSVNDAALGDAVGKAFIFWGRTSWPSALALGDADAILTGEHSDDAAGFSASGTGDINNDGVNDLLISAVHNGDNGVDAGKVYLFLNPSPVLTLLSPNGGELLHAGESEEIRWSTDPSVDNVNIELSTDNGGTWSSVADSVADTGSYLWTVPIVSSDSCRIRIADAVDGDPADVSDDLFSISTNAYIQVTAPNGGESLTAGAAFSIEWNSANLTEHVKIELSIDGGLTWDVVSADEANDGQYSWIVPDRASTDCLVRISGSPTIAVFDVSDAPFTINGSDLIVQRIEAEDAILSDGYVPEDRAEASNGKVARLLNSASNGTIRYNFALTPGEYELFVRYADEIDGASSSVIKIENKAVDEWKWDTADSSDIYVYRRIGVFQFHTGDEIAMWTLRDDGEYARVDYLELKSIQQPQESLTVVKPNGGESWPIGSTQNIAWTSQNTSGMVNIELSRDNGASWEIVKSDVVDTGAGAAAWSVTGPASAACLVRISDVDGSPTDNSDALFSIVEAPTPAITVTAPNGGETWITATHQNITWTSENTSGAVKIDLSRDAGASWESLTANTADDGSFAWTVSDPASANCLVRVADVTDIAADSSDSVFAIVKPQITVIAPNGGESWDIGTTQNIVWRSEHVSGTVKIELSRDSGATWEQLAADLDIEPDAAGNSHISWTVSGPESDACRIKVSATNGQAADVSDADFSIVTAASITVAAPNGGEKWQIGESYDITWTSNKIQGDVKIELSRNNGASYETVTDSTPNDGELQWTVSGPAASQSLVRISSTDAAVTDVSDAAFSIIEPPAITVLSPNGGETWTIGTKEELSWTSVSTSGEVKIELSRDNGASWEEIVGNTADTGAYNWTVTLPAAESCVINISDVAGPASDRSDAPFTIKNPLEPIITVIQPNGGENWNIASDQMIKWFSKDITGAVKIELSRNGGGLWETLADSFAMPADESGLSQMPWLVNGPISENCVVKISTLDGASSDQSDAAFTISETPSIVVTAPNGGEKWQIGSTQTITWTAVNVSELRIQLSLNGGKMWSDILNPAQNSGQYEWTVAGPASDSALVRVSSLDESIADTSDALFAIVPPPNLTVDAPNGGETWRIGDPHVISWHSVNSSGRVDIELTRDNGVSWEALADSTEDDGSFSWKATGPISAACLVRISDMTGSPFDVSDAHFSIVERPTLTLLSPVADDVWQVGSEQTITWESVNIGDKLKIELSRDGGAAWQTLIPEAANSGAWSWTVQQPISDNCCIRISDPSSGLSDKNDGAFLIKFPTGVAKINSDIPDDFALLQNYPNPFNPETRITYQLPEQSEVMLQVYNIQGALAATLVNESQSPGSYMITWKGLNDAGEPMPSGVYFYRIKAGSFASIKRMTFMK